MTHEAPSLRLHAARLLPTVGASARTTLAAEALADEPEARVARAIERSMAGRAERPESA